MLNSWNQLLKSWYRLILAMNCNALIFTPSFQWPNNNKTIARKCRRRNPFWKQYSASDFWGIWRWYLHFARHKTQILSFVRLEDASKCKRFPKCVVKITWTYTIPWECVLEMYTFGCMCIYYLCMGHEGEEEILLVIFTVFITMGVQQRLSEY